MALIIPVNGKFPKIGKNCFLAPNCAIIGDVEIGDNSSVWFNVVIRGDVNAIRIGKQCNIQDGAIIHCTFEKSQTVLGDKVSIGHNAVVHGCTINNNVLVGMGAIVMDHAHIDEKTIIAAGAVVLEDTKIPANSIWGGTPAKHLKYLDGKRDDVFERTANNYVKYASWFDKNISIPD